MRRYRGRQPHPEVIEQISNLTERMIAENDVGEFMSLMKKHENILSSELRLSKVQDLLFSDFAGAVKSLGAWGGDFVMAVANEKAEQSMKYFKEKGYKTMFRYGEIIFEG